jgi:hypothetical protein
MINTKFVEISPDDLTRLLYVGKKVGYQEITRAYYGVYPTKLYRLKSTVQDQIHWVQND